MKPTIYTFLLFIFLYHHISYAQFRDGQEKHNRGTYQLLGNVKQVKYYYCRTLEDYDKIIGKDLNKVTPSIMKKFDEKGNVLEENEYNTKEGVLTESFKCRYDEKGNMIEMAFFDHVEPGFKAIMKYDNKGNKIEVYGYDTKGSLLGKTIMKYNSVGNRIEINYYSPNGSLLRKMNEEEIKKSFKTQESTSGFLPPVKKENTKEFDYDSQGNFIKIRNFENNVLRDVELRVIEYYSK